HVVRVLQRELASSPVFVSFILLLFLLSRVCSQNCQMRKQTWASVPAFVYQMGQKGNKHEKVFLLLFTKTLNT
ncbi:hypothetical protein, partial [Gardnerella vaginalis]